MFTEDYAIHVELLLLPFYEEHVTCKGSVNRTRYLYVVVCVCSSNSGSSGCCSYFCTNVCTCKSFNEISSSSVFVCMCIRMYVHTSAYVCECVYCVHICVCVCMLYA